MSTEREPAQNKPALHPLPFQLPPGFVEHLGYRRDRRFVATRWEPAGDELAIQDDGWEGWGVGDWYPWVAFWRRPDVLQWKSDNEINLGSSDEPATHWLLIDRQTNQAYVGTISEIHRHVQQQRMENLE